jgi:SAM-dependent methyltransferase
VDHYWASHVVCSTVFQSAHESEAYLEWRFQAYPLFREFSGLYGCHREEVVLDYGCGPGNDLVGFGLYSSARKIIGMDVSARALQLAAGRCALHGFDPGRIQLIRTSDGALTIPLADNSVDFINCQGVLQHVSRPETVLREFYRIMKPQGRAVLMVYNRDSLWFHLYTAYQRLVLEGAFPGLDASEAFGRNVDGVACPIARGYPEREFRSLCEGVGFIVDYAGGYLSEPELTALQCHGEMALHDARLGAPHRHFLRSLTYDAAGYPLYQRKHAGIGGVYRLSCWRKATGSRQELARLSALHAEVDDLREDAMRTGALYRASRSQFVAMERDYSALQELRSGWRSLPVARKVHSVCRRLLQFSRLVGS